MLITFYVTILRHKLEGTMRDAQVHLSLFLDLLLMLVWTRDFLIFVLSIYSLGGEWRIGVLSVFILAHTYYN